MNKATSLQDFAARYAYAWYSRDPEKVAAFYANGGSISVNGGPPTLIAEVARGFMRDFPDMTVTFDKLEPRADRTALIGSTFVLSSLEEERRSM